MKRFTETNKWEDPWFRRLKPEIKLLWSWLLDSCDNAGVIDADIELASFQIGYQYPMDTLSQFGHRVIKLECGKFFIPKFIEFQYGTLSHDCKAHNPIFTSLEKHGLKGYPKVIHTLQEKEKEKEAETDGDKSAEKRGEKLDSPTSTPPQPKPAIPDSFEEFWQAYPNKTGKANALKIWERDKPNLETVLAALAWQKRQDSWTKDNGKFIPHASTYLNGKRYEDEKPKPPQPQSCLGLSILPDPRRHSCL